MIFSRFAPVRCSHVSLLLVTAIFATTAAAAPTERMEFREGPAAALAFARGYRGDKYVPKVMYCYPDAVGVPYADCENIIPMTRSLWTPEQLSADFQQRMAGVPAAARKKGIIVILKTERCAPKGLRACTVTTAALEKRATPLAAEFLIYGVLLKPRDNDEPAGSLKIETGPDAWKNDVAAEYQFKQGPGATLGFINAATGRKIDRTDASELELTERDFVENEGRMPKLHEKLQAMLARLARS